MKVVIATGKRKAAIARAAVRRGNGKIRVNRKPLEIWPYEIGRWKMMEPVRLAGKKAEGLDIDVQVRGGGVMGQAEAVRTAIARGIIQYLKDSDLEDLYKEYDRTLVAPDTRRKLPKKPLGRGARKKRQKSYR